MTKTISWFSAGVSSAIATKLLIDEIDHIIYIHIDDQHEDSMRFVKDCEKWFGKPVEILQSHFKTVEDVCRAKQFIAGPYGAPCTQVLKKNVRLWWEKQNPGAKRYVWGMDCTKKEKMRADRIIETMTAYDHIFPLIERGITKQQAHEMLNGAGIPRPYLYELSYQNNNCIGCVKASSFGYWNKIREDFPEVFRSRAKLERDIGASINKDKNGRVFLDELDPDRGRNEPIVMDECGILCELVKVLEGEDIDFIT